MRTKPTIKLDVAQVECLARDGLTQKQIADALGVSESTIYSRQRENAEFAAAIARGRGQGVAFVASALMDHVRNGSLQAAMFFLKTRGGWREEPEPDAVAGDSEIRLIVRRVGSMQTGD